MNPNELRLGNLIWVSETQIERSVESCNIYHLQDMVIGRLSHLYEPIPLTSTHFANFGFEYFNNEWIKDGIAFRRAFDVFMYQMEFEVQNVHDLQNFFFALTKKELKLKQ